MDKRKTDTLKTIITALCIGAVIIVFLLSCSKTTVKQTDIEISTKGLPSLRTYGVSTLISDSGVTRYRIETLEWSLFERTNPAYWHFPQGIFVEQFDSLYKTQSYVRGDTAWFWKDKQLWELVGNVEMENVDGDVFRSPHLFWDQRTRTIYTDKFIHIEQSDRIIEGYGFKSNENLTNYTIHQPQGYFPMPEKKDTTKTNTPPDTTTNPAK